MKQNILSELAGFYKQGTRRKWNKLVGGSFSDPYMKFKEIALLEEIITNLKPLKCLEYGCGMSTAHFSNHLPEGAEWISIEHNQEWFEKMQLTNLPAAVSLNHVPGDYTAAIGDDHTRFRDYIEFPKDLAPFDFILVDGMARELCTSFCLSLLSDDGLLVVHDSNRSAYQPALKDYPNWLLLEDFRKTSGGMGFAGKQRKPEDLFDVEKHKAIWNLDSQISNFFKFKFLIGKKAKPFTFSVQHTA